MVENHHIDRFGALFPLMTAIAVLIMTPTLNAQNPEPVRYIVSFPAPQTHYAVVEADFPTGGQPSIEVFMPVWTPGSYLIREYARNVEEVKGSGAVVKSSKNRWRIETGGAARVRVSYRVYCREMSVRTNWVEDSFALLNGAPTFMTLVGEAGGGVLMR